MDRMKYTEKPIYWSNQIFVLRKQYNNENETNDKVTKFLSTAQKFRRVEPKICAIRRKFRSPTRKQGDLVDSINEFLIYIRMYVSIFGAAKTFQTRVRPGRDQHR